MNNKFVRFNHPMNPTRIALASAMMSVLNLSAQVGSSAGNPGVSAKYIQIFEPGSPSGLYWIRPEAAPFLAYADMSTAGGGWTLGVSSITGSEPPDVSMTANLGGTPTPAASGVLDLSRLAIDNNAQIRFRIEGSLGILDAYFSGNYQNTTLPAFGLWTVILNTGSASTYLNGLYGTGTWNAASLAGVPWYQSGSIYATTPTFAGNGFTQGPQNQSGATITSFQIYIRETGFLQLQAIPETAASAWLLGGGAGILMGWKFFRRRKST